MISASKEDSFRERNISSLDSISFISQNRSISGIKVKKNSLFVCQKIVRDKSQIAHKIYSSHKSQKTHARINKINVNDFGEASKRLVFESPSRKSPTSQKRFPLKLFYSLITLYVMYSVIMLFLNNNDIRFEYQNKTVDMTILTSETVESVNVKPTFQQDVAPETTEIETILPEETDVIETLAPVNEIELDVYQKPALPSCTIIENTSLTEIPKAYSYISLLAVVCMLSCIFYSLKTNREKKIEKVTSSDTSSASAPSTPPTTPKINAVGKRSRRTKRALDRIDSDLNNASALGSFQCLEVTGSDVNLTPVRRSHRLRKQRR